MSGHSKWANTKHRKASQDAKKGKIFTRIIRELVTAAKIGGTDPSSNSRLRTAMDKALSQNMTKETIDRAVFRNLKNNNILMKKFTYEGYGPGGVAIMVDCFSDNNKRIASEIRYSFNRVGGNLGTSGSVSYLFQKKGTISIQSILSEDYILDLALQIKSENISFQKNNLIDIHVSWENINLAKKILNKNNIIPKKIATIMIPFVKITINRENEEKLIHLIQLLKNLSDVQAIYHNSQINI
ncbi:YebC/PmpR family DNA-binding transcriptional regulator [Candidatus Tachikawaea gelatinosa]|uniref:Probable transcriptional regulatory protein TGUWTKB_4880 n=1 Tax=Candidatus Tachikawaea gelatinosa TaxID=1410383 RepID=A0A090AM33_9ENTR|nr:YebC/PmpR family DNA-binding transcriptional regulator [Candidatus Tachikawaea gelatinosa]BAP58714.1 probable transcriptional regulatory protein [Candidatus Tachikawaea gelatinosa]